MKIVQSRTFERKVKKFTKSQKKKLDEEIHKIVNDPSMGTEKKGNLRGVFIHKFKIYTVQCLLTYRFDKETMELIMIGPHENYYRDLKNVFKSK